MFNLTWRRFGVAMLAAFYASEGLAAETQRLLQAAAAVRYLIGNSVEDADDAAAVTYFPNEATAIHGFKSGHSCVVTAWKHAGDCGDSASDTQCRPFYVRTTEPAGARGAVVGHLFRLYGAEKPGAQTQAAGQAILAGDATGCPTATPPTGFVPLALEVADRSVPDEAAAIDPAAASPAEQIERLLIGNSIVWPAAGDRGCDMTEYFGRDGRVYLLRCDAGRRDSFEVGALHWKRSGARFCVEDAEREGAIDICDPIRLTAFADATGTRVHALYVRATPELEPSDSKPGLVVKDNPAQFTLP